MITAALNNSALNLRNITADIDRLVKNLRAKEQGEKQLLEISPDTPGTTGKDTIAPEACAVSYLSPRTVYDIQVFISGNSQLPGKFGYAAAAYDYIFNINNRPQVLIDYMHEYNRSFDFRV